MKLKITITISAILLIILLTAAGVVLYPKYQERKQAEIYEKVKANNQLFIAMVINEFDKDKTQKAETIAQKVCDAMNQKEKNPYNSEDLAFSFDTNCKGCHAVEYDNDLSMVILTTYDKEGNLGARTVIKPPSYVTYFKD